MSKILSVIMTALNEGDEVYRTVESLRQTAGDDIEIIVIDDCSEVPVKPIEGVTLARNEVRLGVAPSRHLGVEMASSPFVLLTDAHMRFVEGWYENATKRLLANPNTVFCGACRGMQPGQMDPNASKGSYNAATLKIDDPSGREILEGKWLPEKPTEDDYDIACLMGALYFFPKSVFQHIRGLKMLRGWGSDEPYLSLKTWLAGYDIRMMKNVQAGHMFRSAAPYATAIASLIFNKLWILKTVFDPALGNFLINRIHRNANFRAAWNMLQESGAQVAEYSEYYRSIFSRDIYWYAKKFNIDLPAIPSTVEMSVMSNKLSAPAVTAKPYNPTAAV